MKRYLFILASLLLTACGGYIAPGMQTVDVVPLTFTDVAQEVGLDFQHGAFRWGVSGDPVAMMGGGLCWLDYDNDGWLDLYVVNSYATAEAGQLQNGDGLPTNAMFRNVGGTFEDVSQATGTDLAVRGNGCVAADFDQDGNTDIYVTTSRVNLLLMNKGDGTFAEVAAVAGVDAYGWQTAANVGDINADGLPDLFVAGYVNLNRPFETPDMGFPNTHEGLPDLLYLNQGVGADGIPMFIEVSADVGLEADALEYGLGAALTDIDADGDLDIFVANDTNPNRLYRNDAADNALGFTLTEIGADANIADTNSGMGVSAGDFDNNQQPDLFITNMGAQLHSLYQNTAADAFANAATTVGIPDLGVGWTGWGTTWADFDNDTDLDLIVINGGIPVTDIVSDKMLAQYYENQTAQGQVGQFVEASAAIGLEALGPVLGRGSAVADFDNDGDLDVAIASIAGPLTLLRNESAGNNWLQVAGDSNSAGAVVKATLADGTQLYREMYVGSSYLASEDPRCHLGLGTATNVAEIQITLPDGRSQTLTNVAANQVISISWNSAAASN